ncbi:type IV secretory system conjugative DNA transfer family protein [Lachnospiraceae bacterium MD308]|nr:type IV secretory system conjugative DNA transfer family protein [Lachnospiraceae bacterium MD308]
MKRDPIVLGENYIISGYDIGISRPNDNALIVGISGCGKSTSVILPTIGRHKHSNPVLSYAKESDAYAMAGYLKSNGYTVRVLNIVHPDKSTVSFDPTMSIESYEDIDALSASIVNTTIKNMVDDYWNAKAKPLLSSLTAATFMTSEEGSSPEMADILNLFDSLIPEENSYSVSTPLDSMFQALAETAPGCYAVREYNAWHSLPYKTASCVRDTLAAALSSVFPESIRKMMQEKEQLNIERFATKKEAVIVITSAVDTTQQYYANLFYRDMIRQLLRLAADRPNGELPRAIRFFFDDFACTAPIEGFDSDISLFRSVGISAIMLLQSESQLEKVYTKEGAAIIRQNCSVYCYFPGGFDDRSCEIVSRRMNMPYEDILYAPLGKVFIMQSGKMPVHIPRYDTLHSKEYAEYLKASKKKKTQMADR